MSTGVWIVIGICVAAYLATRTNVLDQFSGKPAKKPASPASVVQAVAPVAEPMALVRAETLSDRLIRQRINFPEELIGYSSVALRTAANFLDHEMATSRAAVAWSDKQTAEITSAGSEPSAPK